MPKAGAGSAPTAEELHVYEPHRAGLPKLIPYFRDLWARRAFAAEFSKSGIRAANTQTVFGQLWLMLNPLLLALVYYILVAILSNRGGMEYLAHLTGGLFLFFFVTGSMTGGAGSVTGGGKLIMNMNFPRLLMPFAAVRTAFFRFLPTLPVYIVIAVIGGMVWSWTIALSLVFLGLTVVFSMGMAAFLAALQVYFRDTTSFLPYFTRIWLYLSPILWKPEDAPAQFHDLMVLNPLYSFVGGWVDLSMRGMVPEPRVWIAAVLWAAFAFAAGSLFFLSRERDFPVRL